MTNHEAARQVSKLAKDIAADFLKYAANTDEELNSDEVALSDEDNAAALDFISKMRNFRNMIAELNA